MEKQRQVAMISEMIHTASLIHDDVIDQSNYRRGKPSVNVMWNHRKVSAPYSLYRFLAPIYGIWDFVRNDTCGNSCENISYPGPVFVNAMTMPICRCR